MKRTPIKSILLTLSVSLAFIAAGCGLTVQQRAGALRFSEATSDLSSLVEEEITKSRFDVIAMNELRVKLGDENFDPKKTPIDTPLTLDHAKRRIDAISALKEYGTLLHALVTTDQEENLKIAADKFLTNIRKVPGVTLDDQKAGAIGQAIVLGGRFLVEHKRATATRQVTEVAHPHIVKIIELLEREFDPKGEHWTLGYESCAEFLITAANSAKSSSNDLASVALVREARMLASANQEKFKGISEKVIEAIHKLRKAESNLVEAFKSQDVSMEDIDSYVTEVQELIKVYKLIRS
jgi:hypothetical protein